MTVTIGIDGCPAGWVMVAMSDTQQSLMLANRLPFLPANLPEACFIAIDMPIGLSDDGPRGCDTEARAVLGPRGSSVFPVPPRGALAFEDWGEANRWAKAETGRGIPKQSWAIMRRIRELEARIAPADQDRVREAHPELAFLRLNNGGALPRKAAKEGQQARLDLLCKAGLSDLPGWLDALPRKWVKPDDILDAAVLALTARHMANGTAICLGDRRDATGKRMEIWY